MQQRNAPWLPPLLSCLSLACLALPGTASAWQPLGPAPFAQSDAWRPVVQGRLPNGLRYAVLPREPNEAGVGLLMRVEGGFIAERRPGKGGPGERGLSHLIEHVVFASPTTAAPDQMRRFPEVGLPLTFPAASAATTSWRESNYFVSTRSTRDADLDALLGLFREVAGGLTLRADAVDEQRADVMREMAIRKPGNVTHAAYVAAVAPGSPDDVIDGQNHDDVPTASIGTIRALYHRLYRPENMMVVIVGNVDPRSVAALIERRFGDWRGVGPAPERLAFPTFRSDRIAPISYSAQPEGRMSVMTSVAMPMSAPPASRTRQMEAMLMDMVAMRAVNARLDQPGSPPGKTGLFIENGEGGHRLFLLWNNVASGGWRSGVVGLKKTTCALKTNGFAAAAWATAKGHVVGELEQRARDMRGAPNVELAKELSHAVADGRGLIPPDELLAHARVWLPTVSEKVGNDWWRSQWRAGVEHFRVETPEFVGVEKPEAAIRAALAGADPGKKRCRLRA